MNEASPKKCNTDPFFFFVDGVLGLTRRLEALAETARTLQLRLNLGDLCEPKIDKLLQ